MKKKDTFYSVDVGVCFNKNEENDDPYFSGLGPKRDTCIECGGCLVGCRYNAKNSLDKNYLYFAEKFGAETIVETKAEKIEFIDEIPKSNVGKILRRELREMENA